MDVMTSTGEVFPNAPLSLVAMEVRFPEAAAVQPRLGIQRQLSDRLGEEWVIEAGKQQKMELAFGAGGFGTPNVNVENINRITIRDRTQVVTLRADALTVEVTRYSGYLAFRSLLQRVFEAVEEIDRPDGVARLGLRYIDELSVPSDGLPRWSEWVHPSLLPPSLGTEWPESWASAAQYNFAPDRQLVLRYGPSEQPLAATNGPVRRLRVVTGPVFTLDLDSFWQPSGIPRFSAAELLDECDTLRAPSRMLFDSLITEKLLNVFRTKG